ncbi:MAG: histidine phosphatase family protein [Crocinitomicaceae bacterium]|nr:histidine phosphatase family protein [Crocinitomicaceae bacterium]
MKLHLIRHGKAEQGTIETTDINRKLSTKGIKQTTQLGNYLTKLNDIEVWCSDAIRTRETLFSIQKSCQFSNVNYFFDLYLCSKVDLLSLLWKRKSEEDLIIIGHNFGISDLLSYFADTPLEMRTSEYYCLDFGNLARNETSQGTGSIVDYYRPQV